MAVWPSEYDFTKFIASGGIMSGGFGVGEMPSTCVASGAISSGRLGVTGTPTGSKFLRDDFSWQTPAGGTGLTSQAVIARQWMWY